MKMQFSKAERAVLALLSAVLNPETARKSRLYGRYPLLRLPITIGYGIAYVLNPNKSASLPKAREIARQRKRLYDKLGIFETENRAYGNMGH